jgi:flagellar protein FliJ
MAERSLSQRLAPLVHRAERREDEAARTLATKQALLQTHQQRLRDLQNFVHEYAQGTLAVSLPALVLNRAAFVDRLAQALTVQQGVMERSRESCELQRTRFVSASRETEVLEKVVANHVAQEAVVADRRSQRELDDLAGRRSFHSMCGER